MSTTQNTDATAPSSDLTVPAGLNLLGDPDAGSCCGGSCCAVPSE